MNVLWAIKAQWVICKNPRRKRSDTEGGGGWVKNAREVITSPVLSVSPKNVRCILKFPFDVIIPRPFFLLHSDSARLFLERAPRLPGGLCAS